MTSNKALVKDVAVGVATCFALYGTLKTVISLKTAGLKKPADDASKASSADPSCVSEAPSDGGGGVEWSRHAKAVASLPCQVLVTVPSFLTYLGGGPNFFFGFLNKRREPEAPFTAKAGIVACSGSLLALGSYLVYETNRLFHEASGTAAPWDPPRRFVAKGPYRYVRNPMLSGVQLILASEALVLGRPAMLGFAATFLAVNTAYLVSVEEKELADRFGEDYEAYRRSVPMWIPRLTPYATETVQGREQ